MMLNEFSPEVCEQIQYYVYRLIDPRNGQTFYVGKGKGNRIFSHVNCALKFELKEEELDNISAKYQQIFDIRHSGLEVIQVIHRHGLSEKEAFEVESALIDCYAGLTNQQSGHSSERGVTNVETLERDYSLETYIEPNHINYMIIKTSYTRVNNDCNGDIYEATRYSWKLDPKKANKYKYVLGVINGVVRGVYEVDKWALADNGVRYEFFGKDAPDEIKNYFINKRIPKTYTKKGASNPVMYKVSTPAS